ncbi:hypothetical protein OHV05_04355 [Kitasatospora sp. NBC_00070]|uniref:hypothetical protein n=1 Tax=Kitasatospora sp. NBC_00070 TaxID=2975962 RepID=UPI00324D36BC
MLAHLVTAVRYADANNVRVNGGKVRDPEPVKTPGSHRPRPALDLASHPLAIELNSPTTTGGE